VTSLHDLQQAFASAVRFGDAAAIAGFVDANGIEPERRCASTPTMSVRIF
jgi:hypothetical protein